MNNKGEYSIQGLLISGLTIGLVITVLVLTINSMSSNYDTSHIDLTDVSEFQTMENISRDIQAAANATDRAVVDRGAFDFFADIFSKITTPFKTTYRSYIIVKNTATAGVSKLNLFKEIGDYIVTLLTVLVIIGIVMIKMYLGRQK